MRYSSCMIKVLDSTDKDSYNKTVSHIIQSWEWGDFREKTGVDVVRLGRFEGKKLIEGLQITFHKIPHLPYYVGYCPKSGLPSKEILAEASKIAREKKAILIKFEPDLESNEADVKKLKALGLRPSPKSVFANYTFMVDLSLSEEELLAKMHSKTRYNIRVAERHDVIVEEKNDIGSFKEFLKLQKQTAARNKFFVHPESYYLKMWEVLSESGLVSLLTASLKKEVLTAWVIFNFKDTAYYPYGGSTTAHREAMASNLIAWEALRMARKNNFKRFDMWGAVAPGTPQSDPWYGFHRFKEGYGGKLVTFVGAYDLVVNPNLYKVFIASDKLRWFILRLSKIF